MEYILSFDIAKGKSVYCFIDETKNIIIETTSINHNKKEFEDSRIYVDLFPCNECAKKIIQNEIKEVIYLSDKYKDSDSMKKYHILKKYKSYYNNVITFFFSQ